MSPLIIKGKQENLLRTKLWGIWHVREMYGRGTPVRENESFGRRKFRRVLREVARGHGIERLRTWLACLA